MRVILVLGLMTALSGCATNYTGGDQSDMKSARYICERQVTDAYFASKGPGAEIGGALLGPVGALIGSETQGMKLGDMDPVVDKCMADKGYSRP